MKIHSIYLAVILLLNYFMTNIAHAVSIESTGSSYEPGGTRYYFTVKSWEGDGHSFCNDMTAASCLLFLVGAQAPGDFLNMVLSKYSWSRLKPSLSMTDLRNQMLGFSIPFQGSLFVPKERKISEQFCISFAQGYSYVGSSQIVSPKGPCAPVIKPTLQCDIKGNSTLDHNNVSDVAIDGNEASTTLQLTCTGVSSVFAHASKESPSGVKLRPNGSLYAMLSIDGKPAANGVSINVKEGVPTPISIKSTLHTKGLVEPGAFTGSTVLTISPP